MLRVGFVGTEWSPERQSRVRGRRRVRFGGRARGGTGVTLMPKSKIQIAPVRNLNTVCGTYRRLQNHRFRLASRWRTNA